MTGGFVLTTCSLDREGHAMKINCAIMFILLSCVIFIAQNPARSQEISGVSLTASAAASGIAASDEEDRFSFGNVVSFSDGKLILKERDVEQGSDVESFYAVNTETEFDNISTAAQLKAGDNVVLDYIEKDGKRIVTTLVKQDLAETDNLDDVNHPAAIPAINDKGGAMQAVSGENTAGVK